MGKHALKCSICGYMATKNVAGRHFVYLFLEYLICIDFTLLLNKSKNLKS